MAAAVGVVGAGPGTFVRRAFDVAVGAALLLATLPVVVVFAVVLAITLRAWPLFVQVRVGRGGEVFRFWKLRTLPPTAPAYADKYALSEVAIPRFARLLRATHLDELPQLVLVLRGRMSLVGPRPEMPLLHATFADGHRGAREAMRPGCAGLWQVSVDNHRLIREAPAYDLFYARHASLRLDAWVLWRTFLLALGGRRIELADVPAWALRGTVADLDLRWLADVDLAVEALAA